MKKEKLIRKFFPVEDFDMAGLSQWFSQMEAQGLALVKVKPGRAYFRPCTPKPGVRYGLDTANTYLIDQNRNSAYEQMGWDYVTTLQNCYYIYRTEDSSAPPLHTDPVTQSITFRKLIKRRWVTLFLLVVYSLFLFRDLPALLFPNPALFIKLIILKTVPWIMWLVVMIVFLITLFLPLCRGQYRLIKLARQLENGISLDEGLRFPRRFPAFVSELFGSMILLVTFLLVIFVTTPPRVLTASEEVTFPHVTVEQGLAQEEILHIEYDTSDFHQSGNTFSSSLLAPKQYKWGQRATVTFPSEANVECNIYLTYTQTKSPAVANWLLQGLVAENQQYWLDHEKIESNPPWVMIHDFISVNHGGFDQLVMRCRELDGEQRCYYVGQVGNQVITLSYDGPIDVNYCLDLLAEQLGA